MGFLDSIQNEKKRRSFLGSVTRVTRERGKYIQALQKDSQKTLNESRFVSSPVGKTKGLQDEINNRVKREASNAMISLYETYRNVPKKIAEDVKVGAEDLRKALPQKSAVPTLKAGIKTMGRVAGDTAIAIFAPISSAIGFGLGLTNGQKIIDKAGTVIADKSGITDMPAFQKFAIEHPNAGEDFERLLTLAFAGMEKGKIEPQTLRTRAVEVANKLLKDPETKLSAPVIETAVEPVQKSFIERVTNNEPPILQKQQRTTQTQTQRYDPDIGKTAQDIRAETVARGLKIEFPDMAKIEHQTMVQMSERANRFIDSAEADVISVLRGLKLPPEGVMKEAVFTAAKERAINTGDVNMLQELAKSQIPISAGRELKALDGLSDLTADPVKAITEVRNMRVAEVQKQLKTEPTKQVNVEVAQVKEKIKRNSATKQTWDEFINSIEC